VGGLPAIGLPDVRGGARWSILSMCFAGHEVSAVVGKVVDAVVDRHA
jgi:hypothetical protein